jgi:cysteine synthase
MPREGADFSTPLVRLDRFSVPGRVLAKAEHLRPTGSIYDRVAGPVINKYGSDLERAKVGVVAGSGSLGLAFAGAHAAWCTGSGREGIGLVVVCPASTLLEHRILLEAHGVELVLSDPALGTHGVDARAHEETAKRRGVILHAPSNNADAIRLFEETLGCELVDLIRSDDALKATEAIVAPLGPDGLADGIRNAIESAGLEVRVVGTIAKGSEPTRQDGVLCESEAVNVSWDGDRVPVSDEDAFLARMELARKEGLLVGLSSAAALLVARQRAQHDAARPRIAITIDCGDRYFSVDHYFRGTIGERA